MVARLRFIQQPRVRAAAEVPRLRERGRHPRGAGAGGEERPARAPDPRRRGDPVPRQPDGDAGARCRAD